MNVFHSLPIADRRPETQEAIVLTLAVPPDLQPRFSYVQGQHLTLRAWIDGEELRRSYSICAAVQDQTLQIAIKRVPGGRFSNWAHDTLQPGDLLDVLPPAGGFHVPLAPDQARHYAGFAAGSGITPLLSIARTTLQAEPASRFSLVCSNRDQASVMFREALAELKDRYLDRFQLIHLFSREVHDVPLLHGRLDAAKCAELFRRWLPVAGLDCAFVCGPAPMMQAVSEALRSHGLPAGRIKLEYFAPFDRAALPLPSSPAQAAATGDGGGSELTLIVDGVTRTLPRSRPGQSLLDTALQAGVDLRYACKGGVCATCRCRVVEGEVAMTGNYALDAAEVARGVVLSCRSVPVSPRVVLDFDQLAPLAS